MAGIVSYGAYIPLSRMKRQVFSDFWGGFPMPGERAVAGFDEDSLTMAVESGMDCMNGIDPKTVDGLFFATTTAPYKQWLSSSIMAEALDMRDDIRTMDITGALRCGTTAVAAGLDAVEAGSMKRVLVTAGDSIMGKPGSVYEQALGDGGAALLLGSEGAVAVIEGSCHISDYFAGQWRADGDQYLRYWEERMVWDRGYSEILPQAISRLMNKYNLAPSDISKVVYDGPHDMRRHLNVASTLKLDAAQVQDPLFLNVGNTGCALAMMMLVAALEEAKADDRIIFASYGNGADAFLLRVTPEIEKLRNRRGIRQHLASKRMIDNYSTFVKWRELIEMESSGVGFREFTSVSQQRREHKIIFGLMGVKCTVCGTPQYNQERGTTPTRICVKCHAKDQFEDYRFADKKAKIFSFTQDSLADHPDPPVTLTVVNFDGGGRALLEMTDRDPDEVVVGMPVEIAFRKVSVDNGINNYYWKTRPAR
ncbi:OB-fold domain-containing protein [Chloroflexota bacterium]